MSKDIDNGDDIIDSRDVIARIEKLEEMQEYEGEDFTDGDELAALKALASEGEGCSDWRHGETLIRDSYFQDYAEQLAEDLDLIKSDASWPLNCIDWEQAARELQQDYTSIDFAGVTYWVRS